MKYIILFLIINGFNLKAKVSTKFAEKQSKKFVVWRKTGYGEQTQLTL